MSDNGKIRQIRPQKAEKMKMAKSGKEMQRLGVGRELEAYNAGNLGNSSFQVKFV